MSRYIDADKMLDKIQNPYEKALVARWVDDEPTADVVQVRRGKWIVCRERVEDLDFFFNGARCSVCGWWKDNGIYHFCPNCGANME